MTGSPAMFGPPERVEPKATPMSPEMAAIVLQAEYRQLTGKEPTVSVLKNLMAQWSLETARGQHMWNYNFGNLKAGPSEPRVMYLPCSEYVDGERVTYPVPHQACRFRTFERAGQGARAFLELLAARPAWWSGLHSGSIAGYSQGLLGPPAYHTTPEPAYRAGLEARAAELGAIAQELGAPDPVPMARWVLLLAGGAAAYWLLGGELPALGRMKKPPLPLLKA